MACEEDDAVEEVMKDLEALSGIFQGYQKLIYKGKTLNRRETVAQAKLKDGAKIMLIASSTPTETKVRLYHAAVETHSIFAVNRASQPVMSPHIFLYSHSSTSFTIGPLC